MSPKKKKDIFFLFICNLPVSGMMIYWFIWEKEYSSLPWALLPQAVMVLCIVIMLLQEKHILKKEDRIKDRSKADLHQEAFEKYEINAFHDINSASMAKDLKKIYRTKLFPIVFLYSPLCICISVIIIFLLISINSNEYLENPPLSDKIRTIIFVFISVGCLLVSLYELLGLPVYFFLRKHHEEVETTERSYMEGKMICSKLSGINIGPEYCIYYDLFSVDCFPVNEILYAETIKKLKKKSGTAGFVSKVKLDISLNIAIKGEEAVYNIALKEFQLEYLCDELIRRGVTIIKKY